MGTSSSKNSISTSTPRSRPAPRGEDSDDENVELDYPIISNWIVGISSLLCRAAEREDCARFLELNNDKKQITALRISQSAEDRLLMADVEDDSNKQYRFVVFGNSTQALTEMIGRLPTFQPPASDVAHLLVPEYRDSSLSIRPDYFMDIFNQGKTVVIVGHSVGAASAALLTERILNSFLHLRIYNKLMCVTFGGPIIAGRYTAHNIRINKEIYNHFVIDEDVLPRVICIDRNNRVFERTVGSHPTGKLFRLRPLGDHHAECKLLDEAARTEFYEGIVQPGEAVEKAIACNAIVEYDVLLREANVVQTTVVDKSDDSTPCPAEIEAIPCSPVVSLCTMIGLELEIRGEQLSLVRNVRVAGHQILSITYHTQTCVICRVSEGLTTVLDSAKDVDVQMDDCFGCTHSQNNVALRLVGNAKANVFPSALLASVLPLTALLVDGGTLSQDMHDTVEDIRKHVKGVESSIPLEFAFNMMTRNGRDFEENSRSAPVVSGSAQDNLVYLYMFLQRLAEVEIHNWPKLCSTHMLSVLKDSINNLQTLMTHERDGQIRKLLDEAFKPATNPPQLLGGQWFTDAYAVFCQEDYDNVVCTNAAHSAEAYWTFVARCGVDVGFSFVHSKSIANSSAHFHDAWSSSTSPIVAKLESVETLPGSTIAVVLRTFSVYSSEEQVHKFRHFELSFDQEPAKWLSNRNVIRSVADVLIRAKELELDTKKGESSQGIYHVQSFDNQCFLASWFVLNWFLSYGESAALETAEIDRVFQSLQEELPLTRSALVDASLKTFHDAISSSLQKQVQPFFVRNNPRKKVLARLKRVRTEMLSSYVSVVPPFFSGLGVDFLVKESTGKSTKRRMVPFFNFIPKPLAVEKGDNDNTLTVREVDADDKSDETLTLAVVAQRAEQASAGLQFMLLMMDKYEILTKQELFQTQNDTATTALRAAALPIRAIPKALSAAVKVVRYLATGEFSHIIEASSGFRYLMNAVYFSEQRVESYNDFLDKLITNLQLDFNRDSSFATSQQAQISEKLDCIFKSIPPIVGDLSVKELIANSEQIFAHTPWYPLMDSRSKMLHIFMMKQIFHCYHIRSLRSKFIVVGVNGEKNAGKTTLCSLLLGGNVVRARRGLNMDDSTIFPTGYVDPGILPSDNASEEGADRKKEKAASTMIIDLPGCTDSLAYTIPALFFPAVDISIFVISSRQSKKCDSSLSQFINAFVRVRKGPTLLCINGYDKHLEDCIDFDNTYIEHATKFTPKADAHERCANILKKEKTAWQQSATLQLPPSRDDNVVWNCEKNEKIKNCVVHSSLPGNDYPLSIWLTSFLVDQVRYSFANENLMNASHVRQWINESRDWYTTSTYRLNIIDGATLKSMSISN